MHTIENNCFLKQITWAAHRDEKVITILKTRKNKNKYSKHRTEEFKYSVYSRPRRSAFLHCPHGSSKYTSYLSCILLSGTTATSTAVGFMDHLDHRHTSRSSFLSEKSGNNDVEMIRIENSCRTHSPWVGLAALPQLVTARKHTTKLSNFMLFDRRRRVERVLESLVKELRCED